MARVPKGANETFAFHRNEERQMSTASPAPHAIRRYLRHGLLPQLAALEAVVRLGSCTRAAEALCVAQPTLSGHLRKLAEASGVRLFDLRGRRLVPTAAALVLLDAACEVTRTLARCEEALQGLRAPRLGTGEHAALHRAQAAAAGREVGAHAVEA